MNVRELTKKYGIRESELYVYACKHIPGFIESLPHERPWDFDGKTLQQLEQLLEAERREKSEDEGGRNWAHDPADDEPDDSGIEPPVLMPDKQEEERVIPHNEFQLPEEDDAPAGIDTTTIERLEAEKEKLAEQASTYKQELAALRHEYLTVQRDAAAKQEELLAQAAQERKHAEQKIYALREDVAAQKHLAAVRIKEVENRNDTLEQQLMKTREEYSLQTEELMNLQHAIQDLRDTANKKGTQQALELLDAQGQQEKLCKTIHEKDLEIMEAKEKQQELLGKYNDALQRIGEIIGKVMKTRERMKESFAEFDIYIDAEKSPATETADHIPAQDELPPADLPGTHPTSPNPETVEILGQSVGATPTLPETVIKEQAAKPTLWRRIASFF